MCVGVCVCVCVCMSDRAAHLNHSAGSLYVKVGGLLCDEGDRCVLCGQGLSLSVHAM